jgi:hypothetical protein
MSWSPLSENLIFDNIIVKNVGDIYSSYSGTGIAFVYANNNIARNCIVINCAAEGITIFSNNNIPLLGLLTKISFNFFKSSAIFMYFFLIFLLSS